MNIQLSIMKGGDGELTAGGEDEEERTPKGEIWGGMRGLIVL